MEVRPVDTVQSAGGDDVRGGGAGSIDGSDLVAGLDIGLLVPGGLALGRSNNVQGDVVGLVAFLGGISETVGDESTLGPPVVDVGKVPFDCLGAGVPGELVPGVYKSLDGGCIDEADGRKVKDNGAEDRSGIGALVSRAAARAGVIPGTVLIRWG